MNAESRPDRWRTLAQNTHARPYRLGDQSDLSRLLVDAASFVHRPPVKRREPDLRARQYAYEALITALQLGYRLVPPQGLAPHQKSEGDGA